MARLSGSDRAWVLATCVVDTLQPRLVDETIRVLREHSVAAARAGGATCCGQPAVNSGYAREAQRVARTTLRALARTEGPIVLPSGSCATMIRHHWPELFEGTRYYATASSIAARTFELTEFLATLPPRAGAAASERARRSAVAYHASCHLTRHLGARDAPLAALAAADRDAVVTSDAERCCGFGGTFSVKFAGVSRAMADEKLDALTATGARTVTSCDLSCLAHLETRARQRGDRFDFVHIATLL